MALVSFAVLFEDCARLRRTAERIRHDIAVEQRKAQIRLDRARTLIEALPSALPSSRFPGRHR